MHRESRDKHEKPFACDNCDHRFTTTSKKRKHRPSMVMSSSNVLSLVVSFSSSWKKSLANHLKGFHGTAGSLACDHPGCNYRTTWRHSIAKHKRYMHSDEILLSCDHTGCSFGAKTSSNLTRHKNMVHLNIRDNRCHLCEKRFHSKSILRDHMTTHEGDGHEMAKCEDCSVSLKSKYSLKPRPAAGKLFLCAHQGCDYKSRWKNNLFSHQKHAHSEERPFLCNYTGCSFRCKTQGKLTIHHNKGIGRSGQNVVTYVTCDSFLTKAFVLI